jgi:hypothetical protein
MALDLHGETLMLHFFERNYSYSFARHVECIDSEHTATHYYGSCSDGVCLGLVSISSPIILFKTFVSYSMLKGSQIPEFAETERLRKEIHETN